MTEDRDPQLTLMVVDDTPANLKLLEGILQERGYRVRPFPSGRLALRAALAEPPDLILLDVMMPEMDGYETCSRLRAEASTRDVPIIFLSALRETDDKLKAFHAGGVDYVTKPFQAEEVLARVRTHLELMQARRLLAARNRELTESLERQADLERMRDNLVHMMVHDMRSPLMGIGGNLDLLKMDLGSQLAPEQLSFLDGAAQATKNLIEMVSSMLDVSRLDARQMPVTLQRCDLLPALRRGIEALGAATQRCQLRMELPSEPVLADCDPELIVRIVSNLLGNALKFTPKGGSITVRASGFDGEARVSVTDSGPGIPAEFHGRIFEKFGQVRSDGPRVKYSTGLGLTFCKLAIEAQNGRIGVESEEGRGSTFWFELPAGAAPGRRGDSDV
jgi:signal transduction histidine kinase